MDGMTEPAHVPPRAESPDGEATTGSPSPSQLVQGFARWVVWCLVYAIVALVLGVATMLVFSLVGFTGVVSTALTIAVAVWGRMARR